MFSATTNGLLHLLFFNFAAFAMPIQGLSPVIATISVNDTLEASNVYVISWHGELLGNYTTGAAVECDIQRRVLFSGDERLEV